MDVRFEEEDHAFRFLVKTVIEALPTVDDQYQKEFPLVVAEDIGCVPVSLQQDFIKAMYFEHFVGISWSRLWSLHYYDISSNARNYVKFVLYSCLTVYRGEAPFYERFLDVFGVVAAYSLVFSLEFEYHVHAAPILLVFYAHVMRRHFYQAGGWTGLERYLNGLGYLDWYLLKPEVRFRHVKVPFEEELNWRTKAKRYNKAIRFITIGNVLTNEQCIEMVEDVLATDTSVIDVPDERVLAPADAYIETTRRSLLARRVPDRVYLEDREYLEEIQPERIEENVERLRTQRDMEAAMLRMAGVLIDDVRGHLLNAEALTESLKRYNRPQAAW